MAVLISILVMIVTWLKISALIIVEVARFVIRVMVVRVWKSWDELDKLYLCLFVVGCALWFAQFPNKCQLESKFTYLLAVFSGFF